jgi:hypothetical protein
VIIAAYPLRSWANFAMSCSSRFILVSSLLALTIYQRAQDNEPFHFSSVIFHLSLVASFFGETLANDKWKMADGKWQIENKHKKTFVRASFL